MQTGTIFLLKLLLLNVSLFFRISRTRFRDENTHVEDLGSSDGQQGRGSSPQYHQQVSRQGEARRSGLSKELSRYEDYGVDDEDDGSTIVDGDTQVSTQVSTVASTVSLRFFELKRLQSF
jgi:hypothetical protein